MSVLARLKQCQLHYYVDHLPQYLIDNPQGNYRAALEQGAKIIVVDSELTVIEHIHQQVLPSLVEQGLRAVFIPEGGRCHYAETGLKILADEIMAWAESKVYSDIRVVLPAGTGTTALFLQKHLPFEVQACACVGGDGYLKQQFLELCADESLHPTIIATEKKYHFGKLYLPFYHIWTELKKTTNIEFDLLYDPLAWLCLQREFIADNTNIAAGLESTDKRPILYIHQGGLQGNETMIPRYLRKLALVK